MVNVENVRKVIESIRDEDNFFSMAGFYVDGEKLGAEDSLRMYGSVAPQCYTPACICGWAEFHLKKEKDIDIKEDLSTQVSADWLGISGPFSDVDESQSSNLFYPEHKAYNEITRQEAIDTLENLTITGEVNWNTTKGDTE